MEGKARNLNVWGGSKNLGGGGAPPGARATAEKKNRKRKDKNGKARKKVPEHNRIRNVLSCFEKGGESQRVKKGAQAHDIEKKNRRGRGERDARRLLWGERHEKGEN